MRNGVPVRTFRGSRKALAAGVLVQQIGRSKPVIVFDHLGLARVEALLPRAMRSPYLVFLHGIEVWRPLTWEWRRTLLGATQRVANSAFTRRRAMDSSPWLPRTGVLHLCLEEGEPKNERNERLLDCAGSDFLLTVGRMAADERYKGFDELLAAMPEVLAGVPTARLVIAGDGDDRVRLQARAADLGLAGSVVFTGFVNEATLRELYARCAVFAMPSRNEGFGLVYLEAMRAGKPCLALRGSAAGEIIEDGVTGALVEDGSEEQLVNALVRLLRDAELRARLGEAGRKRWARTFTFDAFCNGLRPHLDSLLGGTGKNVRN